MTLSDLRGKRLRGTFYHAPTAERTEVLVDAVIAIDGDGIITEVIAGDDRRHAAAARDAISTAEAQDVANNCVDQPTLDNIFCDQLTRDPSTGGIVDFRLRPDTAQ